MIIGGDVVVAFAGQPVASAEELSREIRRHTPGTTVFLTIVRGKKQRQVKVTLGERPLS